MEIVFICAAFLTLLLLRALDAALLSHRRRKWNRVEGRVLSMQYVACGENLYPTAVVRCVSDSDHLTQKNVRLPGVDFDGVKVGDVLMLLLNPRDPGCSVVDR